jgi:hypothetical protein
MILDLPFVNNEELVCVLDAADTAAGMTPPIFAPYDWRMKYFGDVRSLSLGETPVTWDDLSVIASMNHLRSLSLSVSSDVTEKEIERLTRMPNLNELDITVLSTSAESWNDLIPRFRSLEVLRVVFRPLADGSDRRPIIGVRGEESFWLMRTSCSPDSPDVLSTIVLTDPFMQSVNEAKAHDTKLFEAVANFSSLQELRIPEARLTNDDLKHLYGHPNLKTVILPSSISDETLYNLQKNLPNASVRRYE